MAVTVQTIDVLSYSLEKESSAKRFQHIRADEPNCVALLDTEGALELGSLIVHRGQVSGRE